MDMPFLLYMNKKSPGREDRVRGGVAKKDRASLHDIWVDPYTRLMHKHPPW